MRRRYLGMGVLGLSLAAFIGCGGAAPKADSGTKATPTSSSEASAESESPSVAGSNDGASTGASAPEASGGSGSSGAWTAPDEPMVAGPGSDSSAASSSTPSGSGDNGKTEWTAPDEPMVEGSGGSSSESSGTASGQAEDLGLPGGSPETGNGDQSSSNAGTSGSGTSGSGTSSSGSVGSQQQSGPPQGSNNLPPGYGSQGGPPPQQSGPPQGFNNLPPGYGGQNGPPQQSGPPQGFNNLPPGYGGQNGPPQQSGPPQGFNNLPPGYGGGQSGPPPQQSGPPPQQDAGPRSNAGNGSATMTVGGFRPPGQNGGNPGAPGQPVAPPEKVDAKSFWDMAKNAYADGRDADAYKFLMAEFSANRNRFDEIPLSFSAQNKSTTIGVRLGIGVSYTAREGVSGKPPVIGDPAPAVNRGNQRGSRGSFPSPGAASGFGSGMPTANSSVPKDARGILVYYGGDLATALLDELEQRFKREPSYGLLWPRVTAKVMLKEGVSQVRENQGGGAEVEGPSMAGGNGASVGFGGGQQNGPAEGLFPGLTFLGEGNATDLVRKAKNEGLDGLIVIEHSASVVRSTGATTSQTTVKYFSSSDGKEKAATAQLSYATVANQVAENKDPVGKELKNLFAKIDRLIAVAEMPQLTAEQAKGRLDSIVASSKNDPLPFVNEVNYYLQKGWLIEDDAQALIIQALGEPAALAIWSGDFEKQKSALGRWLPAE
ncbi:MAG: hypothetical protein JNL67_05285 [Planctomycetaceae bacterium]|nr:hypothetical protein [Planctomycetaceae bacterium]